jgi:hypothetical protein
MGGAGGSDQAKEQVRCGGTGSGDEEGRGAEEVRVQVERQVPPHAAAMNDECPVMDGQCTDNGHQLEPKRCGVALVQSWMDNNLQ